MIKVLIVEDENFIRKGLIGTFDWVSCDCTVIGEAENGVIGLEKIINLNPDLVITDIKMPRMNGIDMIKKGKEKVDFETFILSSYDDFSYAKEAIELRVQDYILKPVDEEYLTKSLIKFKSFYEEKKMIDKMKNSFDNNKKVELINMEYYKSNYICDKYTKIMIEYIVSNYNKKISIEDLSCKLGVSVSYLSRKFKAETSQTFHDFLNKYRIQKSIAFLEEGTYKVYEISDMVGFGEYKHFSSVFKKYMSYSPSDYLKNCIN